MASRPGSLCNLVKGKIIDAQTGFVDTFNWLVAFCANLAVESSEKTELDTTMSDRPIIKVNDKSAVAKLESGPDSNVVITEPTEVGGATKIDVYYV